MNSTVELAAQSPVRAGGLSHEMEAELMKAVRERREVPLKFCYLDYGAQLWDGVSTDPDYELGTREIRTLESALPAVATHLGDAVNVLHVGVGNGVEVPYILGAFSAGRVPQYGLLDISERMIALARRRVEQSFPSLSLRDFNCDVEREGVEDALLALRRENSAPALITLIAHGGLLSNMEMLNLIRGGMGRSDLLLVTLELYDEERREEIFASYRLASVEALLSRGLAHLGYRVKEGSLSVSYDRDTSCLNVHALPEPSSAGFRALGYGLKDSTPLRLLSSYKPSEGDFLNRLTASGLQAVHFTHFREWNCCAALCRPI